MDNKSKRFKDLQKEWDKKLEDSGFHDIEGRNGLLKVWSSAFSNKYHNENTLRAKEDYYRAAGHFLHDYAFESKVEKRIWELHGEGLSIRTIVKILQKEKLWFVKGGTVHKRMIHETIQRLKKTMMDFIKEENGEKDSF